MRTRSAPLLGAALAFSLSGLGCGSDASGLLLRFLSERRIPEEADTLDVAIYGVEDGALVEEGEYDLVPVVAFPATLGLVRGPETPDRVRIEAVLFSAGTAVAAGAAVTTFLDGANRQVDVTLSE